MFSISLIESLSAFIGVMKKTLFKMLNENNISLYTYQCMLVWLVYYINTLTFENNCINTIY